MAGPQRTNLQGVTPITPQPGGTTLPEYIVGRDDQIYDALAYLRRRTNLLISDPRRMGKSAFIRRMAYRAPDRETVVHIDYEGVRTSDEFFRRTLDALRSERSLMQRVAEATRAFVDNVEVDAGPLKVNPTFDTRPRHDLLEQSIRRIDKRLDGSERVYLAHDELPLAVKNVIAAEGPLAGDLLLQSLRKLREDRESRIAWVLTGSIGLHHVLRSAGTTEGATNETLAFPLGPLSPTGATHLARALLAAVGREFEDATVAALATRSGGIPWLLHQLAHLLRQQTGPLTDADIEAAWRGFIDDRDASKAVTHFVTRLTEYYDGEERELAERILDLLAVSAEPHTFDQLRSKVDPAGARDRDLVLGVVNLLDDDHYLVTTDSILQWRYDVIRDIWKQRRRLGP